MDQSLISITFENNSFDVYLGGNALAAFVKMLQRWVVDLGLSIPQSKIWEKTLALGIAAEPSPAGDEKAQGAPSNPPSPLHGANGNLLRQANSVLSWPFPKC